MAPQRVGAVETKSTSATEGYTGGPSDHPHRPPTLQAPPLQRPGKMGLQMRLGSPRDELSRCLGAAGSVSEQFPLEISPLN